MADDLRELYQEVILDHGKNPRHYCRPEHATHEAHGHNPLCGDMLDIFITLDEDGLIEDVSFQGRGCAISVASASLMAETLRGKSAAEAEKLFKGFHEMCTGDDEAAAPDGADSGDIDRLKVLSGVRQFPVRVKCATLAWHTMKAAIEGRGEVSTEDDES